MLKAKKKIKLNQKELKQDELLNFVEKTTVWYYANQQKVLIVAAIIIVITGGMYWYTYSSRTKNESASSELGKIYAMYDNQQYQQAIDGNPEAKIPGLKTIADMYSGTNAGEVARLLLANSYYALGKTDDAMKEYENCSLADSRLKAAVYAGVAACYESKKNYADAATQYQKAASFGESVPGTAEYMFNAARCFSLSGQSESAIELLKRIKSEFPLSQYARDIDRYLVEFAG
ncbi:MAG: tetratricopeptide repeat protein [Bacteroidota bacterium]